jgi:hypothetical protein
VLHLVSLTEERAIYLALELDRRWTEMTGVNPLDGTNYFGHSFRFRKSALAGGVLPNGEQRAVLIPSNDEKSGARGCKAEEDAANTTAKITGASIAPTPAQVTQPNLPWTERKDRVRALCAKRRFRSYQQK